MRRHIWATKRGVSSKAIFICLCRIKRTPGLYGLTSSDAGIVQMTCEAPAWDFSVCLRMLHDWRWGGFEKLKKSAFYSNFLQNCVYTTPYFRTTINCEIQFSHCCNSFSLRERLHTHKVFELYMIMITIFVDFPQFLHEIICCVYRLESRRF